MPWIRSHLNLSSSWITSAALGLGMMSLGIPEAAQNCGISFRTCPSASNNGVLVIPQNVIWLEPALPLCEENIQTVTQGAGAPAIVFVIDNSGSMSKGEENTSDDGNDPDEARFTVVRNLLDTLYATSPATEVGLVIFTRRLAFDHRDNAYFKTAFPGDTSQHDSFVPLTPLNKIFADGVKGVDSLKALLRFSGNGNLIHHTKRPGSRPNGQYGPLSTRDGTDISLGFEAAKVALLDAKAGKADQYFIFLSDGEPTSLDDGRTEKKDEFILGAGAPATFTIYFKDSDNPTPPSNMVKMTTNIQNNGYSASNPKSFVQAINLPASQLLDLLQTSVIKPILVNTPAQSKGVTVIADGISYGDALLNPQGFTLPKRIALSPGQTTVSLSYTYSYSDATGPKEKIFPYTLTLQRSAAATALPDNLSAVCREQASLALFHGGQALASVTADHETLEARLTLPAGETCSNCRIQVMPSSSADRENLPAAGNGVSSYAATFAREINSIAQPGNGRLEHAAGDSLVLHYQNPDNALDMVRRSYAYSDLQTGLTVDYHNTVSRGGSSPLAASEKSWIAVGPGNLQWTSSSPQSCCAVSSGPLSAADSAGFVGWVVEATRGFRMEARVFTNTGTWVNSLDMTVPQGEFLKLDRGLKTGSRVLRLLWNHRAADGSRVGTGAYILKTRVTLLPQEGLAGPGMSAEVGWSDYRMVGFVRDF